ncbi:MAG: OmpA family protein [Nitrospirae bacterium]|nr:OmpA family protein [Nitrospirota bacterium]
MAESAAPPIQPAPEVPPTPPAPVLTLTDVYFDYDRYAIRDEAKGELAAVARQLKEDNSRKLLIEGHCDDRGTVDYNMVLGERRAQAVKRYLEGLGVPSSQVETISYGKDKPVCTDHSEDCRQKNRRAHFVLQ